MLKIWVNDRWLINGISCGFSIATTVLGLSSMHTHQIPTKILPLHYNDVIMGAIASQITSITTVYSIVNSDADQTNYQSSASLAFVRGIHRGPVNSPHKWPVTRKIFHLMTSSWPWLNMFCTKKHMSTPNRMKAAWVCKRVCVKFQRSCD